MTSSFVRRGIACLALASLVTVAAACGGDDSDDDAAATVDETTETTSVEPQPEGLILEDLGEDSEIAGVATADEAKRMLDLVNATRTKGTKCGATTYAAAPALKADTKLNTASENHALDMATKNFFSHTGSNGSDPGARITKAGFTWSTYGENIAAGQATPEAAVKGWFASEGHCKNFMNKNFTVIGFGKSVNSSSTYKTYWVSVLAKPR